MSKLYQLPESEKNRIRNLHLAESKHKKISSVLNEQSDLASDDGALSADRTYNVDGGGELKAKMSSQMSDAGDYHMWQNCNGGAVVALFDNQVQTANGQSCHNAVNQGNPGLVLACTQALVNAFGTGPVLSWGIGSQHRSCWEYQGTQFFNTIPNAGSPSQGGSYTVPQTLSNCSQCSAQGDLAWMCTDVGGGVGGTGCQQVTCPYPTVTNMPGQCWDNQQDCNNGGLNPSLNAQPCGGYSGPEHECVNGQCIPWAGGQYPTLAACNITCGGGGATQYCIDCAAQIMNYVPNNINCPTCTSCNQLPGGNWVSIGSNPSPPTGPCYECQNGNCTGPSWVGSFNSQSDCQNGTPSLPACQTSLVDEYECINGQCTIQSGGQFNSGPTSQDNLNACNAVCQSYPNYKCTGGNQGCIQNPNGQYGGATGLADCETACCQNSLANWNWNSNNGGYQNATCQQLTAKFNTPALTAIGDCAGNLTGNVPYNFNHKCRYDWMVAKAAQLGCPCSGGVNTACCSDPGFAVGFATSDPLGCFNQALQTNSQNANGNGFGCPWFCNVLANKHNSLAGTQSPVAQCKHSGAIAFLTDYMTTAQSNFIAGAASFTGPCPNIPNGPGQNNIC